jgi:hypothetical protein
MNHDSHEFILEFDTVANMYDKKLGMKNFGVIFLKIWVEQNYDGSKCHKKQLNFFKIRKRYCI